MTTPPPRPGAESPTNPYRPLSPDFLTELFGKPLDPGYAAAAARRAMRPGQPPPRRWRAVGLVTLLLLGLLLALAYRQVVAEQPTRSEVRADLEEQIRDLRAETAALQQRAEQLRDEVNTLRDQQLGDPAAVRQLRELEAASGLRRVSGDGVVVRLADGAPQVDPVTGAAEIDPQARILYRDLQQVTNELWAAGAEAVAVNGRRLTVTSTIRSASGAILIDREPVAGPYEVAAIGPREMARRFEDSSTAGLLDLLVHKYGITYELRPVRDLTLPSAADPQLRYAIPQGAT